VSQAPERGGLAPRRTPRLLLRRPTEADAERFFEIFGDPRTNAFNPDGPWPDLAHAREVLARWMAHWEKHGFGGWAVSPLEAPERIVGYAGLSWRDYAGTMRVNLGFRFAFEAWGRGYATEIGLGALEAAFDVLALPEVRALARPANLASQRVLRKIGMTEIGTLDDVPGEAPSRLYRAVASAGGGSGLQT